MDLLFLIVLVTVVMPIFSLMGIFVVFILQIVSRNRHPKNADALYTTFKKGLLFGLLSFLVLFGGCLAIIMIMDSLN